MSESDDRLKYAQDFAHAALRGLMIVNGGAIVALFTFIGETAAEFDRTLIWRAFFAFAMGLAFTLAATIAGYFSMGNAYQDRSRGANWWENLGIGLVILAMAAFLLGSGFALAGVMPA